MARVLAVFMLCTVVFCWGSTEAQSITVTPGENVDLTLKLVNVNQQPLQQVTVQWDKTSLPHWIHVVDPVVTASLDIPASVGLDKSFERISVALTVAKSAPIDSSTSIGLLILDKDGEIWRPQITLKVEPNIPLKPALGQNYPNPFNPETWIPFQLSEASDVSIRIYSPSGKVVRTLNLGHKAPGVYENQSAAAYWDGRNDRGESAGSGIYFYQLITDGTPSSVRKMVILK